MRIVTCLAGEHNLYLVLVAAVVCAVGSWISLQLYQRIRSTSDALSVAWVFLGAVSVGATIWCTHFVAMLAYKPSTPVAYDPGITGLSLLIAIVTAAIGLWVAAQSYKFAPAVGGAILGAGISAMHYTGMAAFTVNALVSWDFAYVATSLVFALSLAALSLHVGSSNDDPSSTYKAVGLLILGIVSLHFTAMGALEVVPLAPVGLEPTADTARQYLAIATAGVGILVVGTGVASYALDQQMRRQSQTRQRHLLESSADCMVVEYAGLIIDMNAAFEQLTGMPREAVLGTAITDWVDLPAGLTANSVMQSVVRTSEGTAVPVEIVMHTERAEAKEATVNTLSLRDLRPRMAQENKIIHLARNDALTGLANRHWFREQITNHLVGLDESESSAVLLLDLDRFKRVNDSLGHPVGDALLQAVAQRIRRCIRRGDVIARMGGDEFAILQRNVASPQEAEALAERLIRVISEPYELDGNQISIGTSVGIAYSPADGTDPDILIKKADLALYAAKSAGRGVLRTFERGMDEKAQQRLKFEADLRSALALQQFEIHYQPQVDARSRTVKSFEALLRWRHPERGLVSPGEFIPIAEELGLMVDIGAWVIRQACLDATSWPDGIAVAVNVCAPQFVGNGLEGIVLAALQNAGLPASRLELELTESILLGDTDNVIATMRRLRAHGVRLAMDDFGTGYSSLSYLSRFPMDKIKVDQSFVQRCNDETSLAVIRAVLGLSANLGIATTAEGVETIEQLTLLKNEGFTYLQGYNFSKPVQADQIPALIEALNSISMVA